MFTGTNRRRYIGQQPGTKSASRPGDKPDVNRSSTGRFVPPTVYIGFPLFVLPKRCSGQLFSVPWRARGTVVSCSNKHVGVPSCLARPTQPPGRAPPDPTRQWCVRVLDSTGRISLVLASGESFRRRVFDALEGTIVACPLGEMFCRRPVLPGPAPPPHRALRPDPPVVCPGFELDRCSANISYVLASKTKILEIANYKNIIND